MNAQEMWDAMPLTRILDVDGKRHVLRDGKWRGTLIWTAHKHVDLGDDPSKFDEILEARRQELESELRGGPAGP